MAGYTFTELTPTSFLDRSRVVHAGRPAVVDGPVRLTYAELAERADALTGLLATFGIGAGDHVAALCSNSHVMLELHHGVPLRGAVLVPLNIRLSVREMTEIVRHSDAQLLVATGDLAEAATQVGRDAGIPVLLADDAGDYEAGLATSSPARVAVRDERTLLAINYSSGTTGRPEGGDVPPPRRLPPVARDGLPPAARYGYPLSLDAADVPLQRLVLHLEPSPLPGALSVCLRGFDPAEVVAPGRAGGRHPSQRRTDRADHAGAVAGAAPDADARRVEVTTGGAPPSPALLARLGRLGFEVTHLYGLTETFGPDGRQPGAPRWPTRRPRTALATVQARQGVGNIVADRVRVVDAGGHGRPGGRHDRWARSSCAATT